jgi:hypothetical protein
VYKKEKKTLSSKNGCKNKSVVFVVCVWGVCVSVWMCVWVVCVWHVCEFVCVGCECMCVCKCLCVYVLWVWVSGVCVKVCLCVHVFVCCGGKDYFLLYNFIPRSRKRKGAL